VGNAFLGFTIVHSYMKGLKWVQTFTHAPLHIACKQRSIRMDTDACSSQIKSGI